MVAGAALLVAVASATQDILIDAFRVESLDRDEQAAGMASYVAAYRVGMLVSTAGALYVVTGFEALGFGKDVGLVARLRRDGGAGHRSAWQPRCSRRAAPIRWRNIAPGGA